jgi:kynurenine formamidase
LEIIDLTLTYSSSIRGFASEPAKNLEHDGWNASNLSIYSHAGTHMDSPYHFQVSDERIDQIPVERFISKAYVVTIQINQAQQLITVNDFAAIENKIQLGESIIIKTGWYQFVNSDKYRAELPRISESAAHWLVRKKINILAVEPPSVGDVNNLTEVTKIHQVLLGGNIIIVEGISNTHRLLTETVELIALPLKIKNGDGAPTRVIAIQKT